MSAYPDISISGLVATTRTSTHTANEYDHAITLIDATEPKLKQASTPPNELDSPVEDTANAGSEASLSRRGTKGTLREELVRRKYAKWQEAKYDDVERPTDSSDEEIHREGAKLGKESNVDPRGTRKGRLRDRLHFRHRKAAKVRKQEEYEIDILYENQRGSFFFGVPLYSSKSLLNFDPSAWQTSEFKESAVNITNAQLPDPSWNWAWKTWYVDMSHDVDEEGWEYSFSFRQGFSWHGTHPWFHSFVRRRRWLRKRVKISGLPKSGRGSANEAHMLNADYFTIHNKRDRSRGSSADRTSNNPSNYFNNKIGESESDQDEEIVDILALMSTLKKATIDRKKIQAVRNFLEHGGEELHYLPDRMQDIMDFFIYQTSRRQLLVDIRKILSDTSENGNELKGGASPELQAEERKMDSLNKALQAVNENVKDLEYWSDLRRLAAQGQDHLKVDAEPAADSKSSLGEDGASDFPASEARDHIDNQSFNFEDEIRGIPDSAGVDETPGINWYLHEDENYVPEPMSPKRKGKEKKKEKEAAA